MGPLPNTVGGISVTKVAVALCTSTCLDVAGEAGVCLVMLETE